MVAQQKPQPDNKVVPLNVLSTPDLFDEDAEKAVLGSILTNPEMFKRVLPLLEPADFWALKHQYIWEAFLAISGKGEDIDYLTVKTELERLKRLNDIGGLPYLTGTLLGIPDTSNATSYATSVKRLAIRRKGLAFADETKAIFINQSMPLEDGLPLVHGKMQALMSTLPNRSTTSAAAAIEMLDSKPLLDYIPTGYVDLDKHISGLAPCEVCVSGGDTGMGKSYLILNIAWNLAARGIPVFYASTEMPTALLIWRLIEMNTGVTPKKIKAGLTPKEKEDLAKCKAYIQTLPLYFDYDETGMPLTPGKFRNRAMRAIGEHGIQFVVADHTHDMKLDEAQEKRYGATANSRQSFIVESLVEFAHTAKLPLWMVAQLNRTISQRQDKRPTKHDFRDTGRYEQLADKIVLIHRESVYDDTADPHCTELIVDKVRSGGYTGTVYLYSDDNIRLHNGVKRTISLEDL